MLIWAKGVLVVGDSALGRPYAQKTELVVRHWSGKHHRIVKGINLATLPGSDGDAHIPCDYRIYDKTEDGKTKNDHFPDMLSKAKAGGSEPEHVLSDSWHASLKNPGTMDGYGWLWLTRLRSDRLTNPDGLGNIPLSSFHISESGNRVRLKGYGFIRVFGIVGKNGDTEYWATNDLGMDELRRIRFADFSRTIEEYHRGLRQFCGAERCQCGSAKARRNHIGLAIRAFPGFEIFSLKTGHSWFEAKTSIIRDAVRNYLANPAYAF